MALPGLRPPRSVPLAIQVAENAMQEFLKRWFSGFQPCLLLETNNYGQIFVTSKVSAAADAQFLPPPPPRQYHRQPGPSRLRRRARRAQAREAASTAAETAAATAEIDVQSDQSSPQNTEAAVQAVQPPVRHHPGQEVPAAQAGLQPGEQARHFPSPYAYARDVFCPDRDFQTAEEAAPLHHQQLSIAQLDGAAEAPSLQCDNCSKPFTTRSQLQLHDEMHQFGCDECFLCFTSKIYADLHQLEAHPETSYVRDHIPYSTKQHFARLQHQRL